MAETMTFFQDKKKVTYTLIGLCAAALFFVLICPMASALGISFKGGALAEIYKAADKSTISIYLLYIFPVIAGAMTFFLPEKKMRYIAGGVLCLGFLIFMLSLETGLSMGMGVILYLLFTIAYFAVNFLAKE